jgi:hypothetical protein
LEQVQVVAGRQARVAEALQFLLGLRVGGDGAYWIERVAHEADRVSRVRLARLPVLDEPPAAGGSDPSSAAVALSVQSRT